MIRKGSKWFYRSINFVGNANYSWLHYTVKL